jgi:hypothetical protein
MRIGALLGCEQMWRMLFSIRPAARARKDSARRPPYARSTVLHLEHPLQPSSASRRLATFTTLLGAACALACYQEKAPPSTSAAASASAASPAAPSAASPSAGSASLGLQPVPATHDTAIREVDNFPLNSEVLQRWAVVKRTMDSLHLVDPDVEKRIRGTTPAKSLADAAARFEAEPATHKALAQSGMSAHDFLLSSVALQQAMRGFQLKQTGKLDQSRVPPVVMANINFIATHMPEMMAIMAGVPQRRPTP